MDDVEDKDNAQVNDCLSQLGIVETETTSTSTTTTIKTPPSTTKMPSTTTPIPPTTTITSPTKWSFQPNRIEFFNGPTPFPPGTVIEMGGWDDPDEE